MIIHLSFGMQHPISGFPVLLTGYSCAWLSLTGCSDILSLTELSAHRGGAFPLWGGLTNQTTSKDRRILNLWKGLRQFNWSKNPFTQTPF